MAFLKSRVLERMRQGLSAIGPPFAMFSTPRVAEVMGQCGVDFLWVDMEHRPIDWKDVYDAGIGARAAGVDVVTRLVKTGYTAPMKALEAGAHGVMVPHVMDADEARQWARWSKYPPIGNRGVDVAGPDANFARGIESRADLEAYMEHVNRETFLCIQIEEPTLVECIDEVAAIDGVDVLFIGPADLSVSYGIPFDWEHPKMQRVFDLTAEAAARHGKFWGLPKMSEKQLKENYERGARIFITGYDEQDALIEGMTAFTREFRAAIGEPF